MNKLIKELAEKSNLATCVVSFGGVSTIHNAAEIDKFIELLLEEINEAVVSCDKSKLAIIREPYRKVIHEINKHILEDEDEDEGTT